MNSRQTNCQLEQMWGSTKISSQICLFAYFLCPPPACHRDGQFDSHETCAPASAQPCGCVVCSATHIISQLSLDSIFSCHSNHKSLICTGGGWPILSASHLRSFQKTNDPRSANDSRLQHLCICSSIFYCGDIL